MTAERKPGWWYPYIFVGGFAVVLLVNFTMAYFASSTFSGLSTEQAYEKGLAYNQTLDEVRRQEEMGWTVEAEIDPAANHGVHVTVRYADHEGRPVDGLSVRAKLVRPTARGHDREVALAPVASGAYATLQELPLPGVWDMTVEARGAGGVSYELARRILVP
ncbi:FixH family protein [Magnetospirillum sp. SS-4]|uniref:FixH family protein n=1 Tax=Magnetospirillum sp. SS-4 TaxID=2681465 RepID=UPI00137F410C|nr:FixH family protein [Magnetospirillum sp. SS-4]CAA7612961.1 Predicted integral membrane protein linked to a cation pump [Magnetospirillum sp. SS-4]